ELHEPPNRHKPQRSEQAVCEWQESEHDETYPKIVGLRQRVQARQRVGKAQQPDGTCHEEKRAGADCDDAENIQGETHPASGRLESSAAGAAVRLTRATAAKAASSASPIATSSTPRTSVAAATSSSVAIPPVPKSCAAIKRSASSGPARMRARPTATMSRM